MMKRGECLFFYVLSIILKLKLSCYVDVMQKGNCSSVKLLRIFLLFIVWAQLAVVQSSQSSELNKESELITLLSGQWEPYVGEELADHGFIAQLVKATVDQMNSRLEIKWLPWVRGEQAVLNGEYLATFPYASSINRAPLFYFSDPLFFTQTVFFYHTKHNPNFKFDRWDDLRDARIGGIRGYGYVPSIQKRGLNLHLVNSPHQLVKMLLRNRVDVIAINLRAGWEMITKHYPEHYSEFATLEKKVNDRHAVHVMISKHHPQALAFKSAFNQALAELRRQGVYQRIMQRTLPSDRK